MLAGRVCGKMRGEGGCAMAVKLEVCCGSVEDALTAASNGANRIELNSALELGGLTPSIAAIRAACEIRIPVYVMIRPRAGGFSYTGYEFYTMQKDTEAALEAGASGIVFGILKDDGTLDYIRCKQLVDQAGRFRCVFHRAFDVTPSWRETMDELIGMGFVRILTSGQAQTAPEGAGVIREMIGAAAGRIEFMPGGGIRSGNVREFVLRTGCRGIHASLSEEREDPSCQESSVRFGSLPDTGYRAVKSAYVRRMKQELRKISEYLGDTDG